MENLTFEQSMQELEKLVGELERGNLSLDDSLEKFKKGIELSKHCNKLLDETEQKITILLKENGAIKEEGFKTE